jgi:2-oxoisovalerate dehydrogenase E1 component beta subunit
MMIEAIRDPNPVLFFEHKNLYRRVKGEVPEGVYTTPFGKARVAREGADVTIVAWSAMVHTATDAAEQLAGEGIDVEVIDLRTIQPLDFDAIAESVTKTSKAIVLYEDTRTGGFGGEIAALIAEELFESLDAPVRRVATADCPIPFSPVLEKEVLPQVADVVDAVRALSAY